MKIEPDWYRYLFGTAFLAWLAFWLGATFWELVKEHRRREADGKIGSGQIGRSHYEKIFRNGSA